MSKIIFASNRIYGLISSRLEIMNVLNQDNNVIACGSSNKYVDKLKESGIDFRNININRGGINFFKDFKALYQVYKVIKEINPDIIHCFNAKAIIYFGLVSHFLNTKNRKYFYTITGLGMSLKKDGLTSKLAVWGYKKVLNRSNTHTIFQNKDDLEYFLQNGWIQRSNTSLIVSSGVDIKKFQPENYIIGQKKRIAFVGRLLWDKGIGEFIKAAEEIAGNRDDVEFIVAGEVDAGHPNSVTESFLEDKVKEGVITYEGYINDMPQFFSKTDIFVFPSYYAEGVPRVNLEAAACGIPVITCDSVGCRETVLHGKTGFLVKAKSNVKSAKTFQTYLNRIKRIPEFLNTRKRAKRLPRESDYVYFQEFIENDGYDLKVIVINDKLTFFARPVREGDFRASGGGSISYNKNLMNEKVIKTAFEATDKLNLQCVGFDYVIEKKTREPKIIEMSYNFAHKVAEDVGGYYDKDLVWHNEPLNVPVEIMRSLTN